MTDEQHEKTQGVDRLIDEALAEKKAKRKSSWNGAANGNEDSELDYAKAGQIRAESVSSIMGRLPVRLRQRIAQPSGRNPERVFFYVVAKLAKRGFGDLVIKQILIAHPAGPGGMYLKDQRNLDRAIGQVRIKLMFRRQQREAETAALTEAAKADPAAAFTPEVIARLARMRRDAPGEYEAARKGLKPHIRVGELDKLVTKSLRESEPLGTRGGQGRAISLPAPKPWPEPVDIDAVLDALVVSLRKYVVLPELAADAIALWIVQAHAFEAFEHTPRLILTSPERRCGKSTLLRWLSLVVPKPLPAENITPAALFRTIEMVRPTVLVDEADSFISDETNELRGIINSGHARGGQVIRTVGDEHEPRAFATWAPMVIAAIKGLPATVEDRSVIIHMRRRRKNETVERFRASRCLDLPPLASQIARWAKDNRAAMAAADPRVPEALHDRAADNWRPLLAIADAAGGEWPERARLAAISLSGAVADADEEVATQLLSDIREILNGLGSEATSVTSSSLAHKLSDLEARPWADYRHGKPITQRQVAALLRPYRIFPGTIRIDGGEKSTAKGYYRQAFEDVFSRYLPDIGFYPTQRHNPQNSAQHDAFLSVTNTGCDGSRNARKHSISAPCDGVSDEIGESKEEMQEWRG